MYSRSHLVSQREEIEIKIECGELKNVETHGSPDKTGI